MSFRDIYTKRDKARAPANTAVASKAIVDQIDDDIKQLIKTKTGITVGPDEWNADLCQIVEAFIENGTSPSCLYENVLITIKATTSATTSNQRGDATGGDLIEEDDKIYSKKPVKETLPFGSSSTSHQEEASLDDHHEFDTSKDAGRDPYVSGGGYWGRPWGSFRAAKNEIEMVEIAALIRTRSTIRRYAAFYAELAKMIAADTDIDPTLLNRHGIPWAYRYLCFDFSHGLRNLTVDEQAVIAAAKQVALYRSISNRALNASVEYTHGLRPSGGHALTEPHTTGPT